MIIRNLLERMHRLGVDLSVDGDRIHFKATLDPVPSDLVATLKQHKAAVLSLLRSLPAYDHDTQRALSDWYCAQDRADRLRMHRRTNLMRNEDGIPEHVAACLAIVSERDNFNPRTRIKTLSGPHDADGKTKQPAGHSGK